MLVDDEDDVLEMVENDHVDCRDLMVVLLEPFDDNKHLKRLNKKQKFEEQ